MSEKLWLAIDPGVSGALALVGAGSVLNVWDAPLRRDVKHQRYALDRSGFMSVTREAVGAQRSGFDVSVVIEDIWSRGKQNPKSAFSFGHSLGMIQSVFEMLRFEIEWITPQAWQKKIGINSRTNQIETVREIYGYHCARKDQASAILIARSMFV